MSRVNDRPKKKATKAKRPSRVRRPKGAFWQHKTAEQIAAEQGIGPVTDKDLDEMIGMGKGLWKTDEEFEEFLAGIYERRRQSRGS